MTSKEISAISAISAGLKKLQTDLLSRRNKGNKGKMTSKEISAISAISAGLKKLQAWSVVPQK